MSKSNPAAPVYAVGDEVRYTDRNGRAQIGKIRAIEASWRSDVNREPLIIFTLAHPTYSGRRFYTTAERSIHGLSS